LVFFLFSHSLCLRKRPFKGSLFPYSVSHDFSPFPFIYSELLFIPFSLPLENNPFTSLYTVLFSPVITLRAPAPSSFFLYLCHFSSQTTYSSTLKMEASGCSEMLIIIYQTT
jgi:hypothetical protein